MEGWGDGKALSETDHPSQGPTPWPIPHTYPSSLHGLSTWSETLLHLCFLI